VLRVVASRILSAVRPGDSAARVGGDEFGVLITDLRDPDEAQVVAERIHDSLSRPYEIDDIEVFCTISVGIAYHVPECREPSTMLRYADTAMYLGKVEGQGRVAVFDQQMRDKRVHWLHVQSALRTAVEEHQLVLLYQPIFDLTTDQPVGFEALVRWEHPDDGLITPDEFLDVAEESGLIVPLGEWVVAEVCRQIVEWRTDNPDYDVPPVAINVSGRQLTHPDFVRSIDQALADNGLNGRALQIDISEAALLENPRRAALVLDEITSREIRVDLDDFGTGLSSLGHLQQFPISSLKIDRSFVGRLPDDTESDELVTAIIALGAALGLWVVAKGVETPEQRARLYRLGCHLAQGYLFARPLLPLETARFFLRSVGGAPRRGPLLS
jgi:predicted signal transduction protein with EAL and GGDEF domain